VDAALNVREDEVVSLGGALGEGVSEGVREEERVSRQPKPGVALILEERVGGPGEVEPPPGLAVARTETVAATGVGLHEGVKEAVLQGVVLAVGCRGVTLPLGGVAVGV